MYLYEQLYTLQKIIKSFASIFILTLFTIVFDAQKILQNELKKINHDITKYNLPIFLHIIIICSGHFLEFISYPRINITTNSVFFLFLKKGLLTPLMSLFTYLIFFLFFQVPIIKNLKPIANKLWLCPFF